MAAVALVKRASRQTQQLTPTTTAPHLAPTPQTQLVPVEVLTSKAELAQVLSPTQVRTYLDCSARWWFKYGLALPEPKNSSLATTW